MTSRTNRWLFRATGCAWWKQPEAIRIRFSVGRRITVRTEVERITADFRHAAAEPEPRRRTQLAFRAMADLLGLIGRGDRDEPVPDALFLGSERVASTLPESPMRTALEPLRETPPPDALSPADFRAFTELFSWSAALIDTRTPREQKLEPWIKRGALAMVILIGLWLVLRPHNLAIGRNVTASSLCPRTPHSKYARPRLDRVVDGSSSEPTFALCTNKERHPWVQVDLGAKRNVSRVTVHGRGDSWEGLEDTPLSVQLSTDGKKFKTVAVRDAFILGDFPWSASFSSRRARYVRLTNESNQLKNIVIREIEIYGR